MAGEGLSYIASCAFLNGNPAITLENTIYVKPGPKVPMSDFSRTPDGCDTLLHESTHVIQYATLGFSLFYSVYAAELVTVRGDAKKMYDFRHRHTTWAQETLEGQAQTVGNYAEASRRLDDPIFKERADEIVQRLSKTGIYKF